MKRLNQLLPAITISILFAVICTANGQQAQEDRGRVNALCTEKFTEFAPTISADGNTMIFESNRNTVNQKLDGDRWELFQSKRSSAGVWSEPMAIKSINEKCSFLAGPSLSYDGNSLYFTAFIEGVTTSEDIFYSVRLNDTLWSEPKNLGPPVNSEDYEGFPSISADGNSLYFMRINQDNPYDKKSKENCFEIFVSHRQADGSWGKPEALPPQINLGCVRDPKIMADNHTLIFSAIQPNGKGKYDLYQARKGHDGNWSDLQSLDFINSEENDQSPCISAAGDLMYFYTNKDIYAIPIPPEYRQSINVTVLGMVTSEKTKEPLAASIKITNLTTGEIVPEMKSNPNDGKFSLVLAAGSDYAVEFVNPVYLKQRALFNFKKQESYLEVIKNIELSESYTLRVSARDKDLGHLLSGKVSVQDDQKQNIFDDSVKADQALPSLTLNTRHAYSFLASASRYPEVHQQLVFNPDQFGSDTTYTLSLTHEKVKFVAEVIEITSNKKVKTKVYFNNEGHQEVIVADAGQTVLLRKGDRYQVVTGSDKGYFFSTMTIIAGEGELDADGVYRIKVLLTPIREGASLTLNNITFDYNSADLKKSSFIELDRIIELMNLNPSLVIEIGAHTDDQGNDDYNQKLSLRRAQSVVTYVSTKGIQSKRYVAKGYGKAKPIAPNDTEENRALNRRVELIILKFE